MKKFILFIFVFFIISQNVFSLGLVPAQKEILFEKNMYEFPIKIINNENKETSVNIYAEGKYSQYISFSKNTINFTPEKASEQIIASIKIHNIELLSEGYNTIKIIMKENTSKKSQISANMILTLDLIIIKAFKEPELLLKLLPSNFEPNKKGEFVIEVMNIGSKETNAFTNLEIYDSENKIKEFDKIEKIIKPRETKVFSYEWNPNNIKGEYYANTTIFYKNSNKTQTKKFNIGIPNIEILNVVPKNYEYERAVQINIEVQSDWNKNIPVYAVVLLKKNNLLIFQEKTQSEIIIPKKSVTIPSYINLKNATSGNYTLDILIYNDYNAHIKKESYEIKIAKNNIQINSVATKTIPKEETDVLILIILVIFILLFILMCIKIHRKFNSHSKIKNK